MAARFLLLGLGLMMVLHAQSALVHAASGPYDKAFYGARWLTSVAKIRPFVRGRLVEEKKTLSPWDLPHVRELGHLYFLEDREFSKLESSVPGRRTGETVTEYFFFRKQLAMVRVLFKEEDTSFQTLIESIQADYGQARKETSENPEEVFVQHLWENEKLKIVVSYNPRRVERGFTCENLTMLLINRGYIAQVTAYHDTLREKYGK